MSKILTYDELLRYHRQIALKSFDIQGQEKLKQASVLVVGVGGLGCAAAQYLVSSGVGNLTLLDFDTVSYHNLPRQILHTESRLSMPKVLSAKEILSTLNSQCKISTCAEHLDDIRLSSLIANHDVVLDCSDTLTTRNQLNRLCYQHKTPLVSGAAIRMEGQVSTFTYQADEPCYHCLSRFLSESPVNCSEGGIIAPMVGVVGNLQALETIKLLSQIGKLLTGRILCIDALNMEFTPLTLPRNLNCEICGNY